MPDYRSYFDRNYVSAFELNGKDVTVTIARVEAGKMPCKGTSKTEKKPVLYFNGSDRGLALNKTNAKTVATLYGNKTEAWTGKRVTLFPTTTAFGGETVECIRIRPRVPGDKNKSATLPSVPDVPVTAPPLGEGDEAPHDPLASDENGEAPGV